LLVDLEKDLSRVIYRRNHIYMHLFGFQL